MSLPSLFFEKQYSGMLFEELHEKMARIALELDSVGWRLNHLKKNCQNGDSHQKFQDVRSQAQLLWKDYLARFDGECKRT